MHQICPCTFESALSYLHGVFESKECNDEIRGGVAVLLLLLLQTKGRGTREEDTSIGGRTDRRAGEWRKGGMRGGRLSESEKERLRARTRCPV